MKNIEELATNKKPQIFSLSIEERLQILANLIVDRLLEEESSGRLKATTNKGISSSYE